MFYLCSPWLLSFFFAYNANSNTRHYRNEIQEEGEEGGQVDEQAGNQRNEQLEAQIDSYSFDQEENQDNQHINEQIDGQEAEPEEEEDEQPGNQRNEQLEAQVDNYSFEQDEKQDDQQIDEQIHNQEAGHEEEEDEQEDEIEEEQVDEQEELTELECEILGVKDIGVDELPPARSSQQTVKVAQEHSPSSEHVEDIMGNGPAGNPAHLRPKKKIARYGNTKRTNRPYQLVSDESRSQTPLLQTRKTIVSSTKQQKSGKKKRRSPRRLGLDELVLVTDRNELPEFGGSDGKFYFHIFR